jgi:VLRF1 release factor-like protein
LTAAPRFVGRRNLVARLSALEGAEGTSTYRDGEARFAHAGGTLVVRPPFGLAVEAELAHVHVAPLVAELERDHLVAVLLVRLGGYAVGVLDGDALVASKVGQRLVHGRHRAGGSSANRFRRRRENEMRALHAQAAEVAARVLGPWLERVERSALGGDRAAVRATVAERRELGRLQEIALDRFLTVPDPRRAVLDGVAYDVYAARVLELPPGEAG